MNIEAQRIALAEFEGWKYVLTNSFGDRIYNHAGFPGIGCSDAIDADNSIPTYDSLDDLHRVEKLLNGTRTLAYLRALCFNAKCHNQDNTPTIDEVRAVCFATAAQRREALLRTIGKWVES